MSTFRSNMIPFSGYQYPDPLHPDEHISRWLPRTRPVIVCLCGSTRFKDAWHSEMKRLTQEELKIVLTIGDLDPNPDNRNINVPLDPALKEQLDQLHKRKIDLSDEIFVLNVGGYCGESTRSEIKYAAMRNKIIRWLEPDKSGIVIIELGLATVASPPKWT